MLKKSQIIVLSGALLACAFFVSCNGSKKTTTTTKVATTKVSDVKIKTVASILGVSEKELADKKLYELLKSNGIKVFDTRNDKNKEYFGEESK